MAKQGSDSQQVITAQMNCFLDAQENAIVIECQCIGITCGKSSFQHEL